MSKTSGVVIIGAIIIVALLGYKFWAGSSVGSSRAAQQPATVSDAWLSLVNAGSAHVAANLNLNLPAAQAANQPIVQVSITSEGEGTWAKDPEYAGNFQIQAAG